ncbi:inosine/xanthosine triphosphatase [Thraustotheca clavata]|uniref:inosine/xanthosine triphosphatase n=1 Tax=Thraustotheca clavata TaxID=74557 RepID=A0A1W0A3Y0_9STRA|nr:inosine/xanthosine triphosphatase [Thraustotheca clavata]
MSMEIVVASRNPVKIQAAKDGFEKMFLNQQVKMTGINVASGVSDQPMSCKETLDGAMNRANAAKNALPNANYWIGIEGGVEKCHENNAMEVFAWIVVLSLDPRKKGMAKTANFYLPQQVIELVDQGVELGHADDQVFGRSNSKQNNGAVGLLTNDVITRSSYYEQAVVLALIPFKNQQLNFPMPLRQNATYRRCLQEPSQDSSNIKSQMFPDESFTAEGINIPSGVNDQPMTSRETLDGALNRANGAKEKIPQAQYWIGIEGGLEKVDGTDAMEEFAWIVVLSQDKRGIAKTASFYLPSPLIQLVEQGMELGHASDQIYGKSNSKQQNGAVGLLTNDVITRESYYEHAFVLALIPFRNPSYTFPLPE